VSLGRGLVKIYATCSLVVMYSKLTLFLATYSLGKWYFIGICFIFDCIKIFLEMLIANVFLHMIYIG
jgi:hypothetical protein